MRVTVGAGVLAAMAYFPLGAAAHATADDSAKTEETASAAGSWQRRGPFRTFAICEQRRDTMAGLGYPTRVCYDPCPTLCYVPGTLAGSWYYDIYL